MKHLNKNFFLQLKTLFVLFILSFSNNVWADGNKQELDIKLNNPPSGTIQFDTFNINTDEVGIIAENAQIRIKHEAGLSQITLFSNCPAHWNVTGSVIRQCAFTTQKKGTAITADALGSRAIVDGKVYIFPDNTMKGLQISPDGVFVNGKKVDPLKGSDIPCNCVGDDFLEINIPINFTGALVLGANGPSKTELDNWQGGSFQCTLGGNSSFTAGPMNNLKKAIFDVRGKGIAKINQLTCQIFVANVQGPGQIVVTSGSAQISNATVSGSGSIFLGGSFKNMKKMVEGTGKIEFGHQPD